MVTLAHPLVYKTIPILPMKRKIHPYIRVIAAIRAGIAHLLCAILLLTICHASSNDESSGNSEGSHSQDTGDSEDNDENESEEYDDAVYQEDNWYADDPYYPTDDYYLQQMSHSELNAMNNKNESPIDMHELLLHFLAGSVSIFGLASAVFCTAIFLYFLRVDSLLRRYASEGVAVDGRILASVPDIQEEMKRCSEEISDRNITFADKIQNNDSYSMMTDDESYQISRSEYSGSDGSVEEGQKHGNIKEREQRHPIISGANSAQASTAKSRRPVTSDNTKVPEGRRRFLTMSFRVMMEYDDITYHDIISQESSEVIRKRLLVMGEDIVEPSKSSSKLLVKLHVLKNQPMSGHPCGEVRRAIRWQKRLSFNVYIMLGVALVIGGAIMAKKVLPSTLFFVYIGLIILQVPILNCFLDGSFSKIISDRYLENGLRLPATNPKTRLDDKEKMISALKHGTSFGFV